MKQSNVRALLSRLTEQLVHYFSEDGKITDTKEFSERLALATWEGLILLLRQSIANSDEVLLEEVGYFTKIGDDWIFKPAASLLEVDAMKLEPTESQMYLVQKALFHLQQGSDLLANVADDQELPSAPEADTAEAKLLGAMFGADAVRDSMLSHRIDRLGIRLRRTARRLRGEIAVGREGELTGEHGSGRLPRFGEIRLDPGRVYTTARHSDISQTGEKSGRSESLTEAIDAGKRAYQEEKRRTELEAQSGETEAGQAEP